ncbi:recQ-mediated genome instability protein 1-like [Wyeomyia smithii]|uniref:recQ-mediated genome instability protein 1-like n=1 Tax=Wyeomyia smithii TaxID=174621 RepID=UPI002467E463|nr:recQ-mediated genome instability protein 1-like [Wyeomyia smithii]
MIQTETNRATTVKNRFLREYNIKVVDEWISGCVSFGLQENPKTSDEALFKFAFDQWILADLKEVGVSSLPANVETETKCFTLTGKFPLQLNYLMDISEPCYDQLQNLYNKRLDEAEDEIQMRRNQNQHIKKKRMLKLELTDGQRTVIGMEHYPIAALNTKLPPGVKILLAGPIRCINKVLFLEPRNVRILGGEVDTLLISHAFENILLRALGQPLNPNPKTEYEEATVVEKNRKATHNNIPSIPMVFPSPSKPLGTRHIDDWEDDMFLEIDLDGIDGKKAQAPEQVPTISTLMDDDDDLEIIDLQEREIMDQQVSSTKTSQPSPKLSHPKNQVIRQPDFDYPYDEIDAMNSLEDEIREEQRQMLASNDEEPFTVDEKAQSPIQPTKRIRLSSSVERSPVSTVHQPQTSVFVDDGQQPSTSKNFDKCSVLALFEDSLDDDDFQLEESQSGADDILSPRYRYQLEGHSLATVTQINQLSDTDKEERTFVVFGEVEEVFERIRVTDDGWKLGVMVTDRSERLLPVRFHTTVISKMVGYDASSIQQMKRARNPQVMKLLEEILIKFKNQLQELRTFMRVRYHQGNEFPFVMEIYDCTNSRLAVLTDKANKEVQAKHLLPIIPPNCDTGQ